MKASDNAADASWAGAVEQNCFVTKGSGRAPPPLAPGNANPRTARNATAETTTTSTEAAAGAGTTRASIRGTILTVAVNVIRNLIVRCDVIELAVRQLDSLPALPAGNRKTYPGVICNGDAIRLRRIDPDVMVIAPGAAGGEASTAAPWPTGAPHECLTTIGRTTIWVRQEVDFVLIVGRHLDAKVVVRAPGHPAIITNQFPILAAIIRAPEFAAVGFFSITVKRNAIASFNQRVDSFWIRTRDCQSPFAGHACRQTVTRDPGPGCAFIMRHKQTTAGTSA